MKLLFNSKQFLGYIVVLTFALTSCSKKNETQESNSNQPAPVIESIQPDKGYPGDTIIITGKNYSTTLTDNLVEFGQTDATIIAATSTQLKVIAPQNGTTGPISIKVKTSDFIHSEVNFTYLKIVAISDFKPSSAEPGETITITGSHFSTTTTENAVTFNGKPSTVQTATETTLTVVVPQGATNGLIKVTTNRRTAETNRAFGVLIPPVTALPTSLNWEEINAPSTMADLVSTSVVDNTIVFINTGPVSVNDALGFVPNKWHNLYTSKNGITTDVYNNLPGGGGDLLSVTNSTTDFYVLTSNGVFRSTDGMAWTKLLPIPPSPNTAFNGIAVKDNYLILYQGTYSGAYLSIDNGSTWINQEATNPGATISHAGYINYTSLSANNYFYSVPTFYGVEKLNYSTDGFNFKNASAVTGIYYFIFGYQDILASSGNNVFLVFAPENDDFITLDHQRLHKSSDHGNNWTLISDDKVNTVKALGDYVVYGRDDVNLSINNGDTFTKYAIPAGNVIGGIQIANNYLYIFCKNGSGHKIYKANLQ